MAPLGFNSARQAIAKPFGKGKGDLTVSNVPGSQNQILGNVYNLRTTLEHESRHQTQIVREMIFKDYKHYKYFIEKDAVDTQIRGKWFNKASGKFKYDIGFYPDKFKP